MSAESIESCTEEITSINKVLDMNKNDEIDLDDKDKSELYDRRSQLQGKISEYKIHLFLSGINDA